MRITRSLLCGALAALAVITAMSSFAVVDHAYAASGFGGVAMAMAGMVTIKAPITVFHNGQYVAPGTDIEVSKEEAARLTAAHGAFGGPGEPDPANTQMRNVDIASISALNEHAAIHKGHGKAPSEPADADGGIKKSDLTKLNRDKLVDMAADLKVTHPADATREQIIDAIMTAQEKAKA